MCPGLIQPIRQSAEQRQFGAFLIPARSPLRRAGKESGGAGQRCPTPTRSVTARISPSHTACTLRLAAQYQSRRVFVAILRTYHSVASRLPSTTIPDQWSYSVPGYCGYQRARWVKAKPVPYGVSLPP
jgi:hypothetical protein